MEPLTLTRRIRLDADLDRVWDALRDDDGLSGWLAPRVDLDVSPGAAGRVIETDGRQRAVVVTEVVDGQRLAFTWWDEADPELVSTVELAVEADGDGTAVTVTESLPVGGVGLTGSFVAEASVASLVAVHEGWDQRLGRLAHRLAPALVGA